MTAIIDPNYHTRSFLPRQQQQQLFPSSRPHTQTSHLHGHPQTCLSYTSKGVILLYSSLSYTRLADSSHTHTHAHTHTHIHTQQTHRDTVLQQERDEGPTERSCVCVPLSVCVRHILQSAHNYLPRLWIRLHSQPAFVYQPDFCSGVAACWVEEISKNLRKPNS